MILGSGGLRIGQAGEFDYSGSQAIKALKEEGIRTILVNPNIATVQTDPEMADTVYLQPLDADTVIKILEKERPDGILLSFGGQTALNLGLELERLGVFERLGIRVLGTPVASIRLTEDRDLFKQHLSSIGILTPRSFAVDTVEASIDAAKKIGFPVMMRSGFSLGGLGSGKISTPEELALKARLALRQAPQILIEEYLTGWKEIEYEIVRDCHNQALAICNMENFDPMGIHTGESIVVAPSQTLNNEEYHHLRSIAIRAARHFKIQGECNVQFALHPTSGEYRVIEMNARLSRSSALASKATGYPLAFVAAKLALGYRLDQVPNAITKKTTAFFEPALDYLVVKIPRWDIKKLKSASRHLGTEMKSVGEVMAIGRTFEEAVQKGIRMLNLGSSGIDQSPEEIEDPKEEIANPTDRRLFALYQFFKQGGSVQEAHALSHINPWFLHPLAKLARFEETLKIEPMTSPLLREAKRLGFSDQSLGKITGHSEAVIRSFRKKWNVLPVFKQIDTLAGEFDAQTNYLYATYHGLYHDIETSASSSSQALCILGSGPYCIGSSVEFDWCAVNLARTFRQHGKQVILINSNPETVSTDFDESDRLYFEELTLERVQDIADFERPQGIAVCVGGQIANNLTPKLYETGYPILGTPPSKIDQAENRSSFSTLLQKLQIHQPVWETVSSWEQAKVFAQKTGYPILVRPSYVLSGEAMNVACTEEEMAAYLHKAAIISKDSPIVLSKFIENAKEFELDGVAKDGKILLYAIAEHIENAGVHSGDATLVLPSQHLPQTSLETAKQIGDKIADALEISGPFNIQFLLKDDIVQVIECNLRASRSFPFVSKVIRHNLISLVGKVLLDTAPKEPISYLKPRYIGIKTPQFSYHRLKGSDPVARVEMASTGEVAHIADHYLEAFFYSWLSTEQQIEGKKLLVSSASLHQKEILSLLDKVINSGWTLYATTGTHQFLQTHAVASILADGNLDALFVKKQIDCVIQLPSREGPLCPRFQLRRLAIDHRVPLITNPQLAMIFLQCLPELYAKKVPSIRSWQDLC